MALPCTVKTNHCITSCCQNPHGLVTPHSARMNLTTCGHAHYPPCLDAWYRLSITNATITTAAAAAAILVCRTLEQFELHRCCMQPYTTTTNNLLYAGKPKANATTVQWPWLSHDGSIDHGQHHDIAAVMNVKVQKDDVPNLRLVLFLLKFLDSNFIFTGIRSQLFSNLSPAFFFPLISQSTFSQPSLLSAKTKVGMTCTFWDLLPWSMAVSFCLQLCLGQCIQSNTAMWINKTCHSPEAFLQSWPCNESTGSDTTGRKDANTLTHSFLFNWHIFWELLQVRLGIIVAILLTGQMSFLSH